MTIRGGRGLARRTLDLWVRQFAESVNVDPDPLRDALSDAPLDDFDSPTDFMEDWGKEFLPAFYSWWKQRPAAGDTLTPEIESLVDQLKDLAERWGARLHRHHGKDAENVTLELAFPSGLAAAPNLAESMEQQLCSLCGQVCPSPAPPEFV